MTLIDQIREAGVVGCGGAGFPTHVKFSGKAELFLINGAECEPLLRTDRYLMKHHALALIKTTRDIGALLGAGEVYIALKETYTQEIDALEQAISASGADVKIFRLGNYYPAGDEQMIVRDITGKSVPPGGIPLDVGAVVSNVATVLAVADAVQSKPFTHKYLTVTGEVREPVILRVPVGTAIEDCIRLAGGSLVQDYIIINGGPLMGEPLRDEGEGFGAVTKTTSGLIVLDSDDPGATRSQIDVAHTLNRARSSCIQCSYCTALCPRYLAGHPLEPHRIMRAVAYGGGIEDVMDSEVAKQALICCECGICEDYACPMQLQPRKINILLKEAYGRRGVRYTRGEGPVDANPEREHRKINSRRIAARVGVLDYYDYVIDTLVEHTPEALTIPLNMHIGAPAQPLVKPGDRVTAGQKIATCPEGKLGANIHTGIAGTVGSVGDGSIRIEGGGAT